MKRLVGAVVDLVGKVVRAKVANDKDEASVTVNDVSVPPERDQLERRAGQPERRANQSPGLSPLLTRECCRDVVFPK